jgi:glutamate/tyrosine decarboxylase-like PLP-dependent enzyme
MPATPGTRGAAGLAIWFALAVHGTEVHATAIRRGIELARLAADAIEAAGPPLELVMQPELSVVLFRRRGFTPADWQAWSRDLLAQGIAFVTPTKWRGETVGRLAFLHPDTPVTLIDAVLEPLLV